jgi:lysozyme
MSRTELFDAIRPFAPEKRFTADHVAAIDALADAFGLGRVGNGNSLAKAAVLIKEFEGCKLTAYPDPGSGGDPWTIGWGSTGDGIRKGVTWTQAQADTRLMLDVAKFANDVNGLIGTARTTDNQRAAMISFAYNVGVGSLASSTLLRKHTAGDYAGAAAEFARWNKAAGKVMAGLTRRRAAEAALYQVRA